MSDQELDALRSAAKQRGRPKKFRPEAPAIAMEQGPAEPEPNPRAQQPSRAAQTRQDRRRRDPDALAGIRYHLRVPPEISDRIEREGNVPRWIKDNGLRVQQMQDAGWEPVLDENGQTVTRNAGRSDDSKMVLVDKPKAWVDEEKAAKRRERESNLRAELQGDQDPNAKVNYARGANEVSRSNR